jgi:hypothetical protein
MTLFDDAQQRQVVDETRSIEGLCLLRNELLVQGWTHGRPAQGPLVSYLSRGFTPVIEASGYQLLQRAGTGKAG